jgi:type IV pilus biogenesis protein CpaD/CtpE
MTTIATKTAWLLPIGPARLLGMAAACALLCGCGGELAGEDTPRAPARLGDATERNIAAQAARPADLSVPRRTQARDSTRRETVLASYRKDGGQIREDSIQTIPTLQGGQR